MKNPLELLKEIEAWLCFNKTPTPEQIKTLKTDIEKCISDQESISRPVQRVLYGAMEWINGHIVLDDIKYFEDEKSCLDYISKKNKIADLLEVNEYYATVRLEKAI